MEEFTLLNRKKIGGKMKIIKTKIIETTEEIEVKDGTYYFSQGYKGEEPYEFYKVIIAQHKNFHSLWDISVEKVRNSEDDYIILKDKDTDDHLPITVRWYFTGEWKDTEYEIKDSSAEEFEKQKYEVLKELS